MILLTCSLHHILQGPVTDLYTSSSSLERGCRTDLVTPSTPWQEESQLLLLMTLIKPICQLASAESFR